jgi:hypothetical protein
VLFAVMGASRRTIGLKIATASVFLLIAVFGYKKNLWLVAAALVGMDALTSFITPLLKTPAYRTGGQVSAWCLMWFSADYWP